MSPTLTTAELAAMRDHADDFLPDSCTIQTATQTVDSTGNPILTWADTYTSVACRLDAIQGPVIGGGEPAMWGKLAQVSDWVLSLKYDQAVTAADRVVYGGVTYYITSAETDHTWRTLRRVGLKKVI